MSSEMTPLLRSTSPDDSGASGQEARRWPWAYLRGLVLIVSSASLAMLLSGCISSFNITRDLHILSLSYDTASSQLPSNHALDDIFRDRIKDSSNIKEIRVGYFGLCAVSNSDFLICSSRPLEIAESLRSSGQTDPLNLLWLGNQLRSDAVSSTFVFLSAAILFTTFIGALVASASSKTDGSASTTIFAIFMNRSLSFTCFAISTLFATSAAFTAALWQNLVGTTSSFLVKNLAFGAVACRLGPAALALGWTSFSLACCAFLTLLIPFGGRNTPAEQL
ncbi:unnamed protein product [Clonostachys rosea]|uniref:Actin cortical patch SUR7/pH-response regulator PalI n=1 Tax=Bionectria ochroleuca TaxID=29856 RepID=A0ABY6TYA6_BIOOC|nr:unnamed protein product [Clonostachys rosea]